MATPEPPPPPIAVVLPDGQEVQGVLHERRQVPGTWLHLVGLLVWNTNEYGTPEAAEFRSWVDSEHVRPIDGVSYEAVPTHRLPRTLPVLAEPPPGSRWAWTVQTRPAQPGTAQGTVVHTIDCDLAGEGPELDLDQALAAIRRPGTVACARCDAAASLTPLA
ncbi:DUF6233 domain-containing protein [Streptomyces sp. NPDC016309]|uniref:DUF6233 domain-containing protein n=1 Tax=Streptomyces sp. NPDC016309 TaxID=3364965 RepID=UPI0037029C29